jgi:ABC-2 type transport system ATP-binding protein
LLSDNPETAIYPDKRQGIAGRSNSECRRVESLRPIFFLNLQSSFFGWENSMHIILVNNLSKSFVTKKGPLFRRRKEFVKAVDGISFGIERGQIFSLLGPNGAGKTTTIKVLATLLIPTSGNVRVKGFDVVKDDFEVRKVLTAVLPGERTLFWKLTVKENLFYFGSLYGLTRAYVKGKIDELLQFFSIEDKRDVLVEKLSTGERQKVVLSRALLPDPEVILLDEPTIGLDPTAAIALRKLIRQIAARGKTILLTTHYMYEADELSDTVAIINHGKIACLDTPVRLKQSLAAKRIIRMQVSAWNNSLNEYFTDRFKVRSIDSDQKDGEIQVRIKCGSNGFSLKDISDILTRHGVTANSISFDEPSLEDVFIEMTGSTISEKEGANGAPLLV